MTRPYFSVIIPTKSRPQSLAACLEALSDLDYPGDRFEVIVIDDGSEMPPSDVTDSFRDRIDIALLMQSQAGPAAARNTGVVRAKGDFLAFTDDDCAPSPDWLQRLAARFEKGTDQAVGGKTINGLPDDPYATASQLIVDIVYAYYNAVPDRARFVATNNLAIAKNHLQAVGGFDSSFPLAAEDRDLCDRWLHHGYRITYAPEVIVHHSRRMTLGAFIRQHFSYGRGAYLFQRARVRRSSGHLVKELGFYRSLPNLVRRCLAQSHGGMRLRTVALLAVWQVANAAGFFWEWGSQAQRRFAKVFRAEPRITNAPVKTDEAL